jgi:Domain of unknown function (DUF3471)
MVVHWEKAHVECKMTSSPTPHTPRENHESLAAEGAAVSDIYVGDYELPSGLSLTISRAGDHLFLQMPGQPPFELVRQSGTVYLLANVDDTITFVRNGQGNVEVLILRQGAAETVALRRGSSRAATTWLQVVTLRMPVMVCYWQPNMGVEANENAQTLADHENTAKLPGERLGERKQVGVVVSWASVEKNDGRPISRLIPGELKISSGEDMFFPHGRFAPFWGWLPFTGSETERYALCLFQPI